MKKVICIDNSTYRIGNTNYYATKLDKNKEYTILEEFTGNEGLKEYVIQGVGARFKFRFKDAIENSNSIKLESKNIIKETSILNN